VTTGLAITGISVAILRVVWPRVLAYYLDHHWAMVPGVTAGFVATGLIMQYLTPDPENIPPRRLSIPTMITRATLTCARLGRSCWRR